MAYYVSKKSLPNRYFPEQKIIAERELGRIGLTALLIENVASAMQKKLLKYTGIKIQKMVTFHYPNTRCLFRNAKNLLNYMYLCKIQKMRIFHYPNMNSK